MGRIWTRKTTEKMRLHSSTLAIPEGVEKIAARAFADCEGLAGVELPKSLREIGEEAFSNCGFLEWVSIPEGVEKIGKRAFADCGFLANVEVPASVKEIGDGAFEGCGLLENVTFRGDAVRNLGRNTFRYCHSLEHVAIHEGVTSIGEGCFDGCRELRGMKIPSSVTKIGEAAFRGCESLSVISIPAGVTEIADSLFRDCHLLECADIPTGVVRIGTSAFHGCGLLRDVFLPCNLKEIGTGAFTNCRSLWNIDIPANLEKIGAHPFTGCLLLRTTIVHGGRLVHWPSLSVDAFTIPDGITEIGEEAFANCTLNEVSIPDSVTRIRMEAFRECRALRRVRFPDGLKKIESGTFQDCVALQEVSVSKSVMAIGDNAFSGCSSLKTANIPGRNVEIGKGAFRDCSALETVNLPNYVASIGQWAFHGCSSLKGLNIEGKIKEIHDDAFYSLRNFLELAADANPNILDALYLPRDCEISTSPYWEMLQAKRSIFLSRKVCRTYCDYAMGQIKKARGCNKRIHNPQPEEPPSPEDFCFVLATSPSGMPMRPVQLKESGMRLQRCHAAALENSGELYRLYDYGKEARGVFRNGMLVCESIPKEDEASRFIGLMVFNKNAFEQAKSKHRQYWEWRRTRNEARWRSQEAGVLDYDAKNLMHTFRLLYSALNIIEDGEPLVRFSGEKLQELRDIRSGRFGYDELVAKAEALSERLAAGREKSSLPETSDIREINTLLIDITRKWENDHER